MVAMIDQHALSIVGGAPLRAESGLGSLSIPGYLREVTTRYAEREALVLRSAEGIQRWTYATLWERSTEVARALLAAGVGKNSRVGIMMTNRPELLAAVFGTALAGGIAVPLSTFSTAPELRYLLRTSAVSILLFEPCVLDKDFVRILSDLEPEIRSAAPGQLLSREFPFVRRMAIVGGAPGGGAIESWSDFLAPGRALSPELVEATAAAVQPSDPGMLFFSSGTSAQPKGILNSHRAVAIQLWRWRRLYDDLEDGVRCWPANGFFWSGVFSMALGVTFSRGGALVLQPTFEPAAALELLQAEAVNLPLCWPHQWSRLSDAPNWTKVDLGSLRYVDRESPLGRHPTVRTDWREPRGYGVTETFTVVAACIAGAPPEAFGDSHGEVLPGNTVKIVDPTTGAVMRRGERGEIAVKGPTLMLGYVGVPVDETLDAQGFFRTGDAGRVDESGLLYWEGRLSDIIKTGGANVSPLEVDAVLNTYPGIKFAHTVGVPHDALGEIVVACAVPHEGVALDEAAIRDFLRERLASYKVPRRVLVFREGELSLTGSAKVKSGALRELAAKRLAESS
jgi:acyl-CoA synthetase (AMP-forming)/AMP-acid ligase II